jgi:ketose-bisphosphate aldolase
MLRTLKELLQEADKGRYAVLAPDFPNLYVARVLMEYAEELKAPLALSYAMQFKPYRDLKSFERFIRVVREEAEAASVPVALHLDHAFEYEDIKEAVDLGFTSVMIDASTQSWEVNVERTQRIVALAHPQGVSVESELGHVGTGDRYITEEDNQSLLTDPDMAVEFVNVTGVDALAVSIGTVHGAYRGKPNLDFERLAQLDRKVAVPLVLHGSSGTGRENLRKTVELGIRKINVYSTIVRGIRKAVAPEYAKPDCTPNSIAEATAVGIKTTLAPYFEISGSMGTA